ncbi:NGK_0946 family protein [Lonepinella sp. BR2474]|uniref:NGK_0946 family protein n=1 Tax=Lonepinella sp. BR2474 TaxID=3434548 RepID=UPI003F6E3160
MKKVLVLVSSITLLTACAGSGEINASRGVNSSRVTQAEIDQYHKQRANEVEEAQSQAAKAQGYSETIRQGSSAVQSAVGAINSIRGVFGF